jgi:hypothetical protein
LSRLADVQHGRCIYWLCRSARNDLDALLKNVTRDGLLGCPQSFDLWVDIALGYVCAWHPVVYQHFDGHKVHASGVSGTDIRIAGAVEGLALHHLCNHASAAAEAT